MSTQPTKHLFSEMEARTYQTVQHLIMLRANLVTASKPLTFSLEEEEYFIHSICNRIKSHGWNNFYQTVYDTGKRLRELGFGFDACFRDLTFVLGLKGYNDLDFLGRVGNKLLRGLNDSLIEDGIPGLEADK